ncbi:NADH dehydrogenase [ubiquinone] 1 alpha subcomplex subunit 3 isoform X1 [Artibeus jamaicensis]|uniref:NADH dehydrogenase [ubiquinone] 1 alpha subcomplex subunit 3 isoform X1 n=1 Tax=Artibeus jamaicensis TaxID=9417 RepID=UPI00235B0BA4|nr:NADH dehydrogenase [ubiquinone] 1 alpha subcomplex subunit 3 isoform X1 [Artibeus jamaicensis]
MAGSKFGTRRLPQECLGQGAGAGRVLHHRGPRCVSANVHPNRRPRFTFPTRPKAIVLPIVSPYTKYAAMINKVTPYTYPVPVRDDGNMPDVPSHPQDPQGPSLEWLKKL